MSCYNSLTNYLSFYDCKVIYKYVNIQINSTNYHFIRSNRIFQLFEACTLPLFASFRL